MQRFLFPPVWHVFGVLIVAVSLALSPQAGRCEENPRPNILWLTCEDMGPQLGCYGDRYANTPNLDQLAAKGTIYMRVWSTAPVCAPARTAIISGMYPSTTGSEHMRSLVPTASGLKFYPQFLREIGYYCTNNSKEDYNLEKPGEVWDDSSGKAHWKNRQPGQPFFAIFNFTVTHESQVRRRPHEWVHDPAKVRVPAYHPDVIEVRQDWAQYYDNITTMDRLAGEKLKEIEDAGLADDTIVFFYGDHGPGLPRCKRCPYNSGLQVGLIVYIPPKYRHLAAEDYQPGGRSSRLVSFVDSGPTLLSLVGIKPPDYMQGNAFLGPYATKPPRYLFGLRGRMDERYDLVRSVTDGRFVYLRNYMPHVPWGQHVEYLFETPTTRAWKQLFDAGTLAPEQSYFWQAPKATEELYDLATDPDEVHNVAQNPAYQSKLVELRKVLREHILATRDLGFLPEDEIHKRAGEKAPYDYGQSQDYPLEQVLAMAELASDLEQDAIDELRRGLSHPDSAVRYWAATGLLARGEKAFAVAADDLRQAIKDPSPSVQVVAAWALGQYGNAQDLDQALATLAARITYEDNGPYIALLALNAVDYLGSKAAPLRELVARMNPKVAAKHGRLGGNIDKLKRSILGQLSATQSEK
ncbi:MAG: sulfatase-like hydrolase/transferase [Thermogutta sp.]